MFQILNRIHELLSAFGIMERHGIIREIAFALRDGSKPEDIAVAMHGKYGKLTPEQWAAIVQLIITVLPMILAIFGG